MGKRIVVIGYGTGGMTAAAYAKNYCRECNVIVLEKRSYPIYHPCALPDVISGYLKPDDVIEKEPLTPGIRLELKAKALSIDVENKTVRYKVNSDIKSIEYDKLILAMGSIPTTPGPLSKALELKNVFTLKTPEDAIAIRRKALSSKNVAVIGAGPIGIEVAIALKELRLNVYLIEALPEVLPTALDKDMGSLVRRSLSSKGIKVYVNSPVSEITELNKGLSIKIQDTSINVDFAVMATGMRPNTSIAVNAGIKTNEKGFIIVNEYMKTSVEDVYAVGDIVQTIDYITKKPTISMLATTAFHQGRVAGLNSIGVNAKYPGTLSPFIMRTNGIAVGSTGLTKTRAQNLGLNVQALRVVGLDKPHYMPNSDRAYIKLVYDHKGRILGGQVVCRECNISKYVDIISLAIKLGASIDVLLELETSYMPRESDVYTPLYVAAESALRRLKRAK